MTHYHVAFGNAYGSIFGQQFYDSYEESLVDLSELAQMMFGHFAEYENSLSYNAAMVATQFGQAKQTIVGSDRLLIFWMQCETCQPATLN